MAASDRRIALVCMTPTTDASELGNMDLPSYGVRRILAAVAADPQLHGAQAALIDFEEADVDRYVEAIVGFEPDLVGISVYVWSTPCLVEVARRVKRLRPQCTIVFGGPSARTALFDLPPYSDPHDYLDAIVSDEGEVTFNEIARLPELSRGGLESIGGLDLPNGSGWRRTGARTPIAHLDEIASPYQMGLMRKESVAYLETFRGCPLSCRFCEWGMADSSKTVFSTEYIVRELLAYRETQVAAVFLVDAGLNLNARAFRHLAEAESRTRVLQRTELWCEVYPSHVKDEHLEFLENIGPSYLGIGLQSIDPAVLKLHQRPFDQSRFEKAVGELSEVAQAEVQIIFGLPGDTPDGFRRTLEFARSLPVGVRAYHCLVLPDALMTRGLPEWDIRYNPLSLEMISCRGWSEHDVAEMRATLTAEAHAGGGTSGEFWWFFPRRP